MLSWLVFVCFSVLISEALYCLVSSSRQKYNQTHLYSYPLDYYAPKNVFDDEKSLSIPCSAFDGIECGLSNCHLCSTRRSFCPLHKENVLESVDFTSHMARSSLCILKEKLMNKSETVNVYVTGGSVTVGSYAGGCCPAAGCMVKKPKENSDPCSWPYRFTQWLNLTYAAHVNFVNIGSDGVTSVMMADDLDSVLKKFAAKPFTSNDLIMFDHAFNDNGIAIHGLSIDIAVEAMIRRFYHHSVPQSLPTIVLLASDPRNFRSKPNYNETYEKVGQHYNVPVWSYRNTIMSNFSRTNLNPYLGFLNYSQHYGNHPSWHVHLFMADLYAGIFTYDTHRFCNLEHPKNREMYVAHSKHRLQTLSQLPALSASAAVVCDKQLLSLTHEAVVKNLSPIGDYYFDPEREGWKLLDAYDGRLGGFYVNKEAPERAKIIFTLNITTKELIENRMSFTLFIHYMRSYDNGGLVRVSMCNQSLPQSSLSKTTDLMDGLWADYKTHHFFSLPDVYISDDRYFNYLMCTNFNELRPTIELTFIHSDSKDRTTQSFKVNSIRVCRV